jgi:hypothetical protein
MAVAMPELQDGYKVMYKALTQQPNHLTPFEREFVWLAILAAAGEAIGTHHVKLFRDLGGDAIEAKVVFRLVNLAAGVPKSFQFLEQHWEIHFTDLFAVRAYLDEVEMLIGGTPISLELARFALLAVHTTLGQKWGIERELEAAYEIGAHEGKLVESVCLPMWATGMNRTIDAADIWLKLIRSGRIKASAAFHTWAEMAGQGAMSI